jgi:hypothetical protein
MRKFERKRENFVCDCCGEEVTGNGYTDHCPRCLFGKHVDVFPGDRAEVCGGILEPIGITYHPSRSDILYRCTRCGKEICNKVAENDNPEAVIAVAQKSAERIAKYGKSV